MEVEERTFTYSHSTYVHPASTTLTSNTQQISDGKLVSVLDHKANGCIHSEYLIWNSSCILQKCTEFLRVPKHGRKNKNSGEMSDLNFWHRGWELQIHRLECVTTKSFRPNTDEAHLPCLTEARTRDTRGEDALEGTVTWLLKLTHSLENLMGCGQSAFR